MNPRSISILGATGSVGASTLDLIAREPGKWRVVALTANSSAAELARLARQFRPEIAVLADETRLPELRELLAGTGIDTAGGAAALIEAASRPVGLTLAAIMGCAGLAPCMAAIEQGGTIALANKEALVSAGEVLTRAVAKHGATLLPTDSEHNAIFQCLAGNDLTQVRKITLTASGGPFREWSSAQMRDAKPEQALKHPNWSMGAKITIDSATMMNKGLELIEAHHLFPVGLEHLSIIIHPQSVVHSMVEYRDGSTLAQLGPPDMRVPIASCLAWPQRMDTPCEPLDLARAWLADFRTARRRALSRNAHRAGCGRGRAERSRQCSMPRTKWRSPRFSMAGSASPVLPIMSRPRFRAMLRPRRQALRMCWRSMPKRATRRAL